MHYAFLYIGYITIPHLLLVLRIQVGLGVSLFVCFFCNFLVFCGFFLFLLNLCWGYVHEFLVFLVSKEHIFARFGFLCVISGIRNFLGYVFRLVHVCLCLQNHYRYVLRIFGLNVVAILFQPSFYVCRKVVSMYRLDSCLVILVDICTVSI